jgi:L-asparaginase II
MAPMSEKTATPIPLVEVWRSGRLEGVHYGSVCVCDVKGQVLYVRGDAKVSFYLRSSAKPFQAIAGVKLGTVDRWGFADDEIAMMCASHGGQPVHVAAVSSMLGKCGATPDLLQCGPHIPYDEESYWELARQGQRPQRIHNNCSGKHAGMIASCLHRGWPVDGYRSPDHPLQQEIDATMASYISERPGVAAGTDGCGVPTFYVTLAQAATAFARLASAKHQPPGAETAGPRVAKALSGHPLHIAHRDSFSTILLEKLGKHVVAKGGAEGVFCAGLTEKGVGIAVKITDGDPKQRAIPPVMLKVLEQFLHETSVAELKAQALKPILNTRQEPVGELKAIGL